MVVDTLYGEGTPRNRAELPFSLDSAMESALKSLYERHSKPSDFVPEELFTGIAKTLDSAVSDDFGKEYPELAGLIRDNNEVFAAFKVHDQCSRMAELLTGEDGSLLDFDDWRKLAEPIAAHHNKVWLRTEYDTAVKRAGQAREWMQFRDEKDVLPNLRWVPSTAANPGADHIVFWDTVRPVDDPFWSQHKPGDRWGCQCSLEATDVPETPVPETVFQDPDAGLDNNPADDGKLFSDSHPYYPSSCSTCPFNTGGTPSGTPTNKARDCANCRYLQSCMPDRIEEDADCFKTIKTKAGSLKAHIQHGSNELAENIEMGAFLAEHHGYDIELLPRRYNQPSIDSFNRTLNIGQEYKMPVKPSKTAIDNALRDANRQGAESVVLFIGTSIDETTLTRGITDRMNRCKNLRSVTVVRDGKDVTYTKDEIMTSGWKANWTDLK